MGCYGGLVCCLFAIAANALYTTVRKRGTTRQLTGAIIACGLSALLLIPALVWFSMRINTQHPLPSSGEVGIALAYVALWGWVLPLGVTAAYCLFTLPRSSTTAMRLPRLQKTPGKTTSLLAPPHSQPGVTPPFAFEDEAPWGWLEYKSGNFQGQRLALKRTIAVLGRDENCDIWLDDEMASRHHAELSWATEQAYLTDCGSLNGTTRNGRKVRGTIMISMNDVIEIGTHSFIFIQAEPRTSQQEDDDPLAHHTWRSAQDLMTLSAKQETLTLDYATPRITVPNNGGVLTFQDGELAGRTIALSQPVILVGRDVDCEITIADAAISRHHAQFLCQSDGDYVQDLSSRNGTTVNGETLSGPRRLQAGDTVCIGQLTLKYALKPAGAHTPLPPTSFPQTKPNRLSGPVPLRLPSKQKEQQ